MCRPAARRTPARALAVTDDAGRTVRLAAPARRIVSLAPHATELLYAAGAGARLVGADEFSNYPSAASRLPRIGSAAALDMERILSLRPDLVVAWSSGNSAAQVARLKKLGIPVFESEPRDFEAVASNVERLGRLAGSEATGRQAARAFRASLDALAASRRHARPVTVFYQVWDRPLMTVNGKHMVSSAMRLCGGRNIFDGLAQLAPTVGTEDVVRTDPEVIIGGTGEEHNAIAPWRRFPAMTAVARDNLFTIDPDLLTRPGPRILEGTREMCRLLDAARLK